MSNTANNFVLAYTYNNNIFHLNKKQNVRPRYTTRLFVYKSELHPSPHADRAARLSH